MLSGINHYGIMTLFLCAGLSAEAAAKVKRTRNITTGTGTDIKLY